MMKWVTETLQSASMGPVAVPLALLLGLVSAVASACCTLPAMGMLVAYSGTREDVNRRMAVASAMSFMAGTTMALIVLGFFAGFAGQAAQAMEEAEGSDSEGGADSDWEEAEAMATEEVVAGWV